MGRLGTAFGAFFKILGDADFAENVSKLSSSGVKALAPPPEKVEPETIIKEVTIEKKPLRSDAISLLAALQREARFIDFLQESLDSFPAEQVKAAVLEVHKGCKSTVEKMFSIEALSTSEEGSSRRDRGRNEA